MATRVGNRRKPLQSRPKKTSLHRFGRLGSFVRTDWWTWSFLPLCLLYLILVLTHIGRITGNVYGNSDASSPLVLAELLGDRAGGRVILSTFPAYSTLIFADATKWLPAHRQIWELGPYLLALLSIALMSWAAWRVAGRWAATLTAVILLCAGPGVLELMFWLTNHTSTWYSLALLAAFLVLITERSASIGWLPLAILTLLVGVIVGINVATDKELLISGLLPLLFAGVATWALSRTALAAKAMWFALATAAVSGVSAISTTSIMHSAGVFASGFELKFVSLEALSTNVKIWWQSIVLLGNGNFSGAAITFTTIIELICAALSVGVVLLIPRYAWRYIRAHVSMNAGLDGADRSAIDGISDRPAASAPRSDSDPLDEQLSVYVMFWAASVVFLSAGFVFSSAPVSPVTPETVNYLVGIVYAVAAMLPLLARRSVALRVVVVAGTLVFLLNSVIALEHSGIVNAPESASGPSPQVALDVARTAEAMHATDGYGLYWDAAAITWRANFRVLIAPIVGCEQSSTKLCPGPADYLEEWYYPRPRRTFLLTDSSIIGWGPPGTLGRAAAIYHFGTVTMYVYNYNIIEKLL
jgi:hypothetical protein